MRVLIEGMSKLISLFPPSPPGHVDTAFDKFPERMYVSRRSVAHRRY
jgi:hypothetical protein